MSSLLPLASAPPERDGGRAALSVCCPPSSISELGGERNPFLEPERSRQDFICYVSVYSTISSIAVIELFSVNIHSNASVNENIPKMASDTRFSNYCYIMSLKLRIILAN